MFTNQASYTEMPYTAVDLAAIVEAKSRFRTQHDGKDPQILLVSQHTWQDILALPGSQNWFSPIGNTDCDYVEPLGKTKGMFAGMQVIVTDRDVRHLCVLARAKVEASITTGESVKYKAKLWQALALLPQSASPADHVATRALIERWQH